MTAPLAPLRFVLMLVLASSPLVSSAMAADGTWSRVWANPFAGTVQAAEEEEPAGEHDAPPTLDEAVLWALTPQAVAETVGPYRPASGLPPAPPLTGDPTPPPERA